MPAQILGHMYLVGFLLDDDNMMPLAPVSKGGWGFFSLSGSAGWLKVSNSLIIPFIYGIIYGEPP